MDIDYKILWFEDTDEPYNTLSRRTKRYVEQKNLRCAIDRISGASTFDISKYDLNSYDVLVVDLQLAEGSKGYDIISAIRACSYVNDILFYSAAGVSVLEEEMKKYRLEGVFLSDRDNREFMGKIQKLIDKSVRRSENVINIRGIVMDETSEFDSQMKDIILAAQTIMSESEILTVKKYIRQKLLKAKADNAKALFDKYSDAYSWELSNLLEEHEFTSIMRARLVNKIFGRLGNKKIIELSEGCHSILPEIYSEDTGAFQFAKAYDENVLSFRNMLAHAKQLESGASAVIGTIKGIEYRCDTVFCTNMRKTLIRYGQWFDKIYEKLKE